jgi:hypothetical protein
VNGRAVLDTVVVKLYTSYQLGARVSVRLSGSSEVHHRVGLRLGASYNDLLKFGFGGGFDIQTSRHVSFVVGMMYYPEAADVLRDRLYDELIAPELRNFVRREDIEFSPILTVYQLAAGSPSACSVARLTLRGIAKAVSATAPADSETESEADQAGTRNLPLP